MKTRLGFWKWSSWSRDGKQRLKTVIARSPAHRGKAPKRKKIILKRPRTKSAFF
jgi:hypothetical protein